MKKIITLYIVLLCAVCASASPIHVTGTVNYGTAYRGSGRMYSSGSTRYQATSTTGSYMAQAPAASMGSTSRGIATTAMSSNAQQVAGIRTSASAIQGGVTTYDAPKGHARKSTALPGGACPHCDWQYDPATETWYCPYCDCDPYDGDGSDCGHTCVPVGDGTDVWMLVAALAGVYALYKARARKEQLI